MLINGRMATNLLNFFLFQAGWCICVLGAAAGHPWLATAGGLLLAALLPLLLLAIDIRAHLAFVFRLSALLLSYVGLGMVIGGLLEVAEIAGWVEAESAAGGGRFSERLLVAMLMLIPIYFIVRDWWTEAEDATLERLPGVEDPPRRDD